MTTEDLIKDQETVVEHSRQEALDALAKYDALTDIYAEQQAQLAKLKQQYFKETKNVY